MADLKAFAEQLVNLTVKEVSELATILKEEYGIEPAAAAVAVAGPAAGGAAAAAEEKTSFYVPTKLPWVTKQYDIMNRMFEAAKQNGMKLIVGLYPGDYSKKDTASPEQ